MMAVDEDTQALSVALLKKETEHLDELARLRHQELIRRWDRHETDHKVYAKAFTRVCERVAEIETQQRVEKEKRGALARLAAGVSAGAVLLAEAIRWGWTNYRE